VLELVTHYQPASEEERFDILEVLDFGLNHRNSAVVMATAKLFLHYTLAFPAQHQQVLETLKDPLQTLIQGREPEVVFAVLSNFLVLAQRYPLLFSQVGRFLGGFCSLLLICLCLSCLLVQRYAPLLFLQAVRHSRSACLVPHRTSHLPVLRCMHVSLLLSHCMRLRLLCSYTRRVCAARLPPPLICCLLRSCTPSSSAAMRTPPTSRQSRWTS
jgi:hypothetical protein